jgi:flavonol synthase
VVLTGGDVASQIRVIDLAAALAEDAPADLLQAVRDQAEQLGLIQVTNHGVGPELIADLGRRADRLLSLPRAEKARMASPHPYRGWRQWPDDFGRLELERFNVAQFDNPDEARAAGVSEDHLGLYAHQNLWPAGDPGLREVAYRYLGACRGLAGRVLGLYARLLGVPPDTFALGELPHLRLTVNNYPTWTYPDAGRDEDKLLLLEHADDSVLTVLGQDGDYEGLQVQLPDGGWTPVPIVPGALQVFSGKLFTRWTNGRMRPARHRVVAGGADTRRSIAVFCYPELSTVLGPAAPFLATAAATEQPVPIWDHVKSRAEDYLAEYGRPEQIAAWRDGTPYVAPLADTSAGR